MEKCAIFSANGQKRKEHDKEKRKGTKCTTPSSQNTTYSLKRNSLFETEEGKKCISATSLTIKRNFQEEKNLLLESMVSLFNFVEWGEGDDTRAINTHQNLREAVRRRNGAEQGLIFRDHQGALGNEKKKDKNNK
ncbi:hypothetical protein CDAR_51921 [Caerostris darwini]|uniref:Uncharacterized protein n=1 Tax=Caerostris darwini TaxID=1538125 RepID=A0AAV4X774_9ARAC|nr:hypothetical protein CDAR_51921 [Caerostris darwini]